MAVNRLDQNTKLLDEDGYPTMEFQILWNSLAKAIEDLEDAVEALEAA